jgi:hypothetical protein
VAIAYMLGGRPYRSAAQQPTWRQGNWTMALLRRHPAVTRAIDSNGDVLGALLDTDQSAEFLAGWLVEDGETWSPEVARKNSAYFNGLTDPEGHAQLYDALTILLADFLALGGSSSTASPTSSGQSARKTGKRGSRRRPPAPTPPTSLASGPTSSPPSPSTPASA